MKMQIPTLVLRLALAGSPVLSQPQPGIEVTDARFETASAAGGLAAAVRQAGARSREPLWVAWSVPMVAGQPCYCCWSHDKGFKNVKQAPCNLEGKNQSWGGTDSDKVLQDQRLHVLVRMESGEIGKVRAFSASCPLNAGGRRFVWLGEAKPEESVAFVAGLAGKGTGAKPNGPAEEALTALAFHRNAGADDALEDLASATNPGKVRENALFWMGQTRGERGARFLTRTIESDPNQDIREKAIFSLSQSDAAGAADTIIQASREDRSPKIRGEALFWLAQMDDPRSADRILQAIDGDPDLEVKKKGVFALSQLKDGGVPQLVRLGRQGGNREVRKEALFWLAQSDDPAALKYLDKVLND